MTGGKIDDGGPAFPFPAEFDQRQGQYVHSGSPGMSQRMAIAVHVLPAILSDVTSEYRLRGFPGDWRDRAAREAWALADAMLRTQGEPT